jgi:IS5 family transposase
MVHEGIVMLESLRKKREAELQVRILENRIRRLKEEEH